MAHVTPRSVESDWSRAFAGQPGQFAQRWSMAVLPSGSSANLWRPRARVITVERAAPHARTSAATSSTAQLQMGVREQDDGQGGPDARGRIRVWRARRRAPPGAHWASKLDAAIGCTAGLSALIGNWYGVTIRGATTRAGTGCHTGGLSWSTMPPTAVDVAQQVPQIATAKAVPTSRGIIDYCGACSEPYPRSLTLPQFKSTTTLPRPGQRPP